MAGVPLMLYRSGEGEADGLGSFTGDHECFPVLSRDGGCGEVFDMRNCEGGVD